MIETLKRFKDNWISSKINCLYSAMEAFAHADCWKKGIIGLGNLKKKFYNDNDF